MCSCISSKYNYFRLSLTKSRYAVTLVLHGLKDDNRLANAYRFNLRQLICSDVIWSLNNKISVNLEVVRHFINFKLVMVAIPLIETLLLGIQRRVMFIKLCIRAVFEFSFTKYCCAVSVMGIRIKGIY